MSVAGDEQEALERAEAHFNRGEYRQALEEFEAAYHGGAPERRELYLGLVRATAALYHREAGHPHSVRRLHASAKEILARWAEHWEAPWDLGALIEGLDRALGAPPASEKVVEHGAQLVRRPQE